MKEQGKKQSIALKPRAAAQLLTPLPALVEIRRSGGVRYLYRRRQNKQEV
jgi:hypothetical protein